MSREFVVAELASAMLPIPLPCPHALLSFRKNRTRIRLHLFGGTKQDFVDADVFWLSNGKDNGSSDILTL